MPEPSSISSPTAVLNRSSHYCNGFLRTVLEPGLRLGATLHLSGAAGAGAYHVAAENWPGGVHRPMGLGSTLADVSSRRC